jgi:hypothetical protein
MPSIIGIKAATLDDPSWFKATADSWMISAQPWDLIDPKTKKFERDFQA